MNNLSENQRMPARALRRWSTLQAFLLTKP